MPKITMDGKYVTRGGYPVRINSVDNGVRYPIRGEILATELASEEWDGWLHKRWTANGFALKDGKESAIDLIEVKGET